MRYLTLEEVLDLHDRLLASSGGAGGIRDVTALQSALLQPYASFSGVDLYPDLISKASALGFSLIMNHPFMDGNKRAGHAAMETFLALNGWEIDCGVDEQEGVVLDLAAGRMDRELFTQWVRKHTVRIP